MTTATATNPTIKTIDQAKNALARTLKDASQATSTAQFTALVTNALTGEDLDTLVHIESVATGMTAGLPTGDTAPLMVGIGRAVTDAAHRIVTDMTKNAEDTPARARTLLDIMGKNITGWTVIGLREQGADYATICNAELAEAAETQLDNLMYEVHGSEWFTIMDEPLDRAIAAPHGNTIYRDALAEQVSALQ